jgi:autophagy-related protein 2
MPHSAATPNMHPTIYLSDSGAGGKDDRVAMLSLAMKVEGDKEANRKNAQLAISINGATLRHQMLPQQQQWITQLSEFFNVLEDSVPGYKPVDVVTSLYIHLYSCMIDYRPLFLPFRAALTIGSFSLSSNIVYTSPQSVLRLILNTVELHLSNKTNDKVDLQQDYVCVGDLGSFDLLLKTSSNPVCQYLVC